jgi:hypothetical protein
MNSQTNQVQNEIRENIISLFDIDKLPDQEQEEMISKIGKIIFESVLTRVLPMLSENELTEYEGLIENKALPNEVMNFLISKIPSFVEIVIEESENFRKESADFLSQIK